VTLRVELDERGRVDGVTVVRSSGHARLDAAARAAVLTWQCNAATREGQPIRAVATQTLEFVLTRR
jgi:protein TonB